MEYSNEEGDARPHRMTELFSDDGFLAVYIECVVVEITTTTSHVVITEAIEGDTDFEKKHKLAVSFAQFCKYCCDQRMDPALCAHELIGRLGWTSQMHADEDGYYAEDHDR